MDIRTASNMCKVMPSNQSILLVGQHGVGKSHFVRQIAAHFHKQLVDDGKISADLAVCDKELSRDEHNPKVKAFLIDMRLSQMSEGDMIGLPEMEGEVTTFRPPAWFMEACREPRVIFLDEINRATPEVMQAAFQVVLDFQLNGYKLHPDTRVFAAVNPDRGNYAVNGMDAALLDRFAVIELTPTAQDWFDWASGTGTGKGDILSQIVSFLRSNEDFLDPPAAAQPGEVYQSRRSWELLSDALRHAKLDECFEKNDLLYALAITRVGPEAAMAFQDHVQRMKTILAEDILNRWSKKMEKEIDSLGAEKYNILVDKIAKHCAENDWTAKQGKNCGAFMATVPGEICVNLWNKISESRKLENLKAIHPHIVERVVELLKSSSDD